MQAIRVVKEIRDKKIVVDVPKSFKANRAEVIILPSVQKSKKRLDKSSELLLNGPSLSKQEIRKIKNARKWMGEWKVPQF